MNNERELIQKGKNELFLDKQYISGTEFHGCFIAEIKNNKVTITNTFPKETINIDYNVNAKFDEKRQSIVDVNDKLIQGAKKLNYILENTKTGTNENKITGFFTAKITQNGITFTNIYLGECSMSEMQNSLQQLKNKRRQKPEVKEPPIQPEVKEPPIQPEVKEPAIQTALVIAEQLRTNAKNLRNANTIKQLNSAYDNYNKYFDQATKAYDSVKNINFVGNQIFGMNTDKIKDMYNIIDDEYNTIKSQWDNIIPLKKDDISKAKVIVNTCAGLLAKFTVLLEHYRYAHTVKYRYAHTVKAKGGRKTRKLRPRNSSDKSRPS
jgi:hypothetical protein